MITSDDLVSEYSRTSILFSEAEMLLSEGIFGLFQKEKKKDINDVIEKLYNQREKNRKESLDEEAEREGLKIVKGFGDDVKWVQDELTKHFESFNANCEKTGSPWRGKYTNAAGDRMFFVVFNHQSQQVGAVYVVLVPKEPKKKNSSELVFHKVITHVSL